MRKKRMVSKERVWSGKVNICVFAMGILAVMFMGLPYFLLGQDSIVTYHDQLDGELIAYLLQAKHLFAGDMLPEFMNGVYKTALIPPAPAFVLLFCVFDGFWGLVVMQLLGSLCGYIGMYLLVTRIAMDTKTESLKRIILPLVAMTIGVLYAYLPFLPVYGLAQYGLPLLLWCFLQAKSGKYIKTAYIYGAVYALCSSLVLVGFGVLGAVAVWILWCFWQKHCGRKKGVPINMYPGHMTGIWATMLFLYVIENLALLKQTLGIGTQGDVLSHKAEYELLPKSFRSVLLEGFTQGGQHSVDSHVYFWVTVLIVLAVGLFCRANKKLMAAIAVSVGCNFCFAVISAVWDSSIGVNLRLNLNALGAFQMNRLLWMSPCLWYLALACAVLLALEMVKTVKGFRRGMAIAGGVFLAMTLCITGGDILLRSNLKPNIQKLRNPEYAALSFRDYYAVGVLGQVENYIRETTGQEPADYRVVSLGIDPAAALYHGFWCLDGYSNNYPLDYKHSFRRIIEPELNKSDYLKQNFDDWGNRCYLFGAECPGYYTIEKNGFYFQDYSLNTEALKEMGGKYLFSAAYIANADETGLKLVREEPFETEDSYYRIFLYEVE